LAQERRCINAIAAKFLLRKPSEKEELEMKRPCGVLLAVVLCAGLMVAGCATSRGIKNAQAQLGKAKAAGAENSAAFEYYTAEAYLGQAVRQSKEGDNKQAKIFTKQSTDYSAKALGMAKGGAK
jgi:predicted small secreted protein